MKIYVTEIARRDLNVAQRLKLLNLQTIEIKHTKDIHLRNWLCLEQLIINMTKSFQ